MIELGRRQGIDRIARQCDLEIQESIKLYDDLMENFSGVDGAQKQKQEDETVNDLKALESKLSKLATQVHEIYTQLDVVEAQNRVLTQEKPRKGTSHGHLFELTHN